MKLVVGGRGTTPAERPGTVVREERVSGLSVLRVAGPLRWPVSPVMGQRVEALLGCGERTILVDLADVTAIYAAAVGEVVRLHGLAASVNAELRIANVSRPARKLLAVAGLFELLNLDSLSEYEKCS